VQIADTFWAPRREMIRTATLWQQHDHLRNGGQLESLRLTWSPGDLPVPHIFWESDVAKWIEAASYCLAHTADGELEAAVDDAIGLLSGAQQADGYLNVYFTVVQPRQRFTDLRDAHELYCAGHLIEAGVAHYEATGKQTLLEIVRRYADLVDVEFAPGGACEGGYDGHEEIELALVKLYRVTGERRYLELSRRLILARGTRPFYFDREEELRGTEGYFGAAFAERAGRVDRFRQYNQSHLPVVEQVEVVGHSVRAMYLYCAMTDLAVEFDDPHLWAACRRLWASLTQNKLYITGGVGSDPTIEGFGPDYDLPDAHGYAETCAAIGLTMWAQRMANASGDASYVDVLERALYNGVLSGVSEDGTHYFYDNPLASDGSHQREEWFGVACCPPNLARLLSSLEHYIYSQGPDEAVINLYIAGSARFGVGDSAVVLTQATAYPRDGAITIAVDSATAAEFTICLRIPAWCGHPGLRVNGEPVDLAAVIDRGYARIRQRWSPGDRIELSLPMQARRIWANTEVAAAAGKVALQRGPLVFCLEGIDHTHPIPSIVLPRDATIKEVLDPRTGVVQLSATATADTNAHDPELYASQPPGTVEVTLSAGPYFAWNNRGRCTMRVWIRDGCP
jgi:DUF1680 family protein